MKWEETYGMSGRIFSLRLAPAMSLVVKEYTRGSRKEVTYYKAHLFDRTLQKDFYNLEEAKARLLAMARSCVSEAHALLFPVKKTVLKKRSK